MANDFRQLEKQAEKPKGLRLMHGWITIQNVSSHLELHGAIHGGVVFPNPNPQTGQPRKVIFYVDGAARKHDIGEVRETIIGGPERLVCITESQLAEMKHPTLVVQDGMPQGDDCEIVRSKKFDGDVLKKPYAA